MLVESGAEGVETQMSADSAELLLGLDHTGYTPPQDHFPAPPPLDVPGVDPADLDCRLDGVGRPEGVGLGGWHGGKVFRLACHR